ncbi:Cdc4 and related F-box and WD-40 proteins [Ceraceosorus bombacis]|uniref:Cdc4 and related F-box and WD-40 proteins n=1 Tax=Ceraceosorus bombacis TaxID=401625 RepID=A0A0P1BS29_9BASI|nr:Cdc4 and related F-box and WD-40 proteins [Ceraceosorus bombacis]
MAQEPNEETSRESGQHGAVYNDPALIDGGSSDHQQPSLRPPSAEAHRGVQQFNRVAQRAGRRHAARLALQDDREDDEPALKGFHPDCDDDEAIARALAEADDHHSRSPGDQEATASELDSEEADSCPLLHLPPELLVRILAFLDPISLATAARTCRLIGQWTRDDSTWRLAFALAFGLENKDVVPSLRRIESGSWKLEYFRRSETLRRWRKSRAPTVIHDPHIATLSGFALNLQHSFLLSVSQTHGVAARSNPFSGKVALGFLDARGGIVNHTSHADALISAVALDADAGRVIWGSVTGGVTQTTLTRQGNKPHALIRSHAFSGRAAHAGSILAIAPALDGNKPGSQGIGRAPERLRQKQEALGDAALTFVTAGTDATVRLWCPSRPVPLWTGLVKAQQRDDSGAILPPSRVAPPPVVCVDYDASAGVVAAGTSEGEICIWKNLDVKALLALPATALEEPGAIATPSQREARERYRAVLSAVTRHELPKPAKYAMHDPAVESVVLEQAPIQISASCSSKPVSLLARYARAPFFCKHTLHPSGAGQQARVISRMFSSPTSTAITSVRPDFEMYALKARRHATSAQGQVVKESEATPVPVPSSSLVLGQPSTPLGEASFAERTCVFAGTMDGHVCAWDWSDDATSASLCSPVRSLEIRAHHCAITAIDVTAHAVVVGAADGTIKAFCPLSGAHIRTFNDRTATRHPARALMAGDMSVEEASKYAVSQIASGPDTLVAAIGPHVLAWRAGPLIKGKRALGLTGETGLNRSSGRPARTKESKFVVGRDLRDDVQETATRLQNERDSAQAECHRLRFVAGSAENDLDEQDALQLALMLSRDEAEAGKFRAVDEHGVADGPSSSRTPARGETPPPDDIEAVLQQIAIAESQWQAEHERAERSTSTSAQESEHDFTGVEDLSTSASPSPSPSPHSLPLTSPSRAWDIIATAGSSASPSTRAMRRTPNAKVQTVQVPAAARRGSQRSLAGGSLSGSLTGSANLSATSGPWTPAGVGDPPELNLDSSDAWPLATSPSGPHATMSIPSLSTSEVASPSAHAWRRSSSSSAGPSLPNSHAPSSSSSSKGGNHNAWVRGSISHQDSL